MRAHIIDGDGRITNTEEVYGLGPNMVDADEVGGGMGDSIIDGVLVPAAPVVRVPQQASRRQCLTALLNAGKYHQLMDAVAGLPEPHRTQALIDLQADPWHRDHPRLIHMAANILALDGAGLDALFIAAESVV